MIMHNPSFSLNDTKYSTRTSVQNKSMENNMKQILKNQEEQGKLRQVNTPAFITQPRSKLVCNTFAQRNNSDNSI